MKIKSIITLILSLVLSTVSVAQKGTNKANILLDEVRKDLTALTADFEQYEINANKNISEKSTGKVWLNAPNQFKWQYQKPIPQLIVANGKQVWIYDEDLEQVTIKQQQSQQNPIYVLLNKQQTEEHYQISLQEKVSQEDPIQWVQMLPKKPSEEIKVVWLGIENKNLVTLKLQNQLDNIVIFEFNNIERNPKLVKDFFDFEIPKGIDVIRDSAVPIGES